MKIAYYPISLVHMRNLELLAKALPDFEFRLLYRYDLPWFTPEKVDSYGYEHVFYEEDNWVEKFLDGDVGAIILSVAMGNRQVCALIEAAYDRNIPIIAIEEVLQIALNGGGDQSLSDSGGPFAGCFGV